MYKPSNVCGGHHYKVLFIDVNVNRCKDLHYLQNLTCYSVLGCPFPDAVDNAVPSVMLTPWLAGDSFLYVCNDSLVLLGIAENRCNEAGNTASWDLSMEMENLPMCGG